MIYFHVEKVGDQAYVLGGGSRWFLTTPRRAQAIVAALRTAEGQAALVQAMKDYRSD